MSLYLTDNLSMKKYPKNIMSFRHSRLSAGLALFAMFLQVFFSSAHLAALAAASGGPLTISSVPNASFGLLQICTANGLLTISENGKAKTQDKPATTAEQCPICSSASIGVFSAPENIVLASVSPNFAITHFLQPEIIIYETLGHTSRPRAPPALILL